MKARELMELIQAHPAWHDLDVVAMSDADWVNTTDGIVTVVETDQFELDEPLVLVLDATRTAKPKPEGITSAMFSDDTRCGDPQ